MEKIVIILLAVMILFCGCSIQQTLSNEQPYIEEVIIAFSANFALASNGNIFSWGANEQGILGIGEISEAYVSTPQKIMIDEPVKKLVTLSNANTIFAITTSGKIYGWGANTYKTISSENVPIYYSPVLVDFEIPVKDIKLSHYLVTVMGANEKLYGYGWTQAGGFIHPNIDDAFSVSDNNIREILLDSNEPVIQFESSTLYRVFLNTKGEVFIQGTLAEEYINYEQATLIPFPERIIQVGPMFQGLLAVSETGKLYFIGEDRFGIAGKAKDEYYDVYWEPTLIDKLSEAVQDISVSSSSVIARTQNDDLYTWGYNLGKNDADSNDEIIDTPNKLDFNMKVRYYYCGEFSSVCITEDNVVYAWGSNGYQIYMDDSREASYKPTILNFG